MNPKKMLTNGVFCPMPWTGLMVNFDGKVKNCIRSAGTIGNLHDNYIEEILDGQINRDTQSRMLEDKPGKDCHTCYDLENAKKSFEIISDRIFYIRELKTVPMDTYRLGNHDLQTIDVRWSNLCNFACVYCGPEFSSRWASEIGYTSSCPSEHQMQNFKDYIFAHAENLKHVYLAGGEPLLMKENLEVLNILRSKNPLVHLRINTNLSKTDTMIFEKICEFPNVHWTISVESLGEHFEYIRYGGSWQDFSDNLKYISRLPHKITFNMLYFLLNHRSLFNCIDWLMDHGFHANSFVAGPLLRPMYLNIRHLPDRVLQSIKSELVNRISQKPGYLLEDSYRNILRYIDQPFDRNLQESLHLLSKVDHRRRLDSKKIFEDLYNLI